MPFFLHKPFLKDYSADMLHIFEKLISYTQVAITTIGTKHGELTCSHFKEYSKEKKHICLIILATQFLSSISSQES